jgi:signal transduction histidine kinase
VLQEQGLGPALEALAGRLPLPIAVDVRLDGRLPDVVEATGYFAAGEALANVLKHAGAERVRLAATAKDGELVLSISDDGRGGADAGAGSGLVGLADRLEAIGGSLSVDSPAGAGTTLVARIPQG